MRLLQLAAILVTHHRIACDREEIDGAPHESTVANVKFAKAVEPDNDELVPEENRSR
jgi:hypothetical protein